MLLAYDIRGHGDSATQNGESRRHNQFTREDWKRAIADIGIAKKQILAHGASPDNLFVVGSSIGANFALLYGNTDSDIQGVVLLSPGIEYKGINIENTVKENRRLPLLLMAAEGDRYSANSIEKISVWSPSYTELRTYSGTSHGTDLLSRSDRITNDIFGWLKPILK
jgi:alpha-beta hydrolase superfamily lysophospholipase